MQPGITSRARAWLPTGAAEYASSLSQVKHPNQKLRVSSSDLGELILDNDLSRRLLLSRSMKKVWGYFDTQDTWDDFWKDFIFKVQFAARGPGAIDQRSFSEQTDDRTEFAERYTGMKRVLRRYGIDLSKVPIGAFYDRPSLDSIFSETKEWSAIRGQNTMPLDCYISEIQQWMGRQNPLVKEPNHPDADYQFFARCLYNFFKTFTNKPNKWTVLSIITSVSLERDISANRIRGTCLNKT